MDIQNKPINKYDQSTWPQFFVEYANLGEDEGHY
jgi:hypothetical protein